ncbi:hypothetical protein RvY_16836 [Ramazzottius varieornatus]|uniref:GH16 domain-containing protein n=1 Tax=Ramazzottius varieornatus TaxID=947166 RepID=A0A1D1W456_RAMVA|nr:hypothetical protein RvY_16836 [Ramazzottius varieornatus]
MALGGRVGQLAMLSALPLVFSLSFSGREWTVKNGDGMGPGPNSWSASNVWVDDLGHLHLKISHVNGRWQCAEVSSVEKLGFGRYQWFVDGAIDKLDPVVVLGLFNYPGSSVGPDGTNEIDIEYSRWSDPNGKPASYTVHTGSLPPASITHQFDVSLSGTFTTQSFVWSGTQIAFSAQHGHQDNNSNNIYSQWTFTDGTNGVRVPQHEESVFMNLWLNKGQTPFNNQEVEIVIYAFKFTPL